MNLLTELGLISAAHDLERRLDEGTLETPLHLPDGATMFVWRGRADEVAMVTWMPRFPNATPFERLAGSDIWVLQLSLPRTAMIEYRLGTVRSGRQSDFLDPLNPNTTSNPFGVNSLATGPDYGRPAWSHTHPETPVGTVSGIRVRSAAWGERRHHLLYLPHGHDPSVPLPLVLVHDGPDFLEHSALGVALDNLIAWGELPPLAAILHHPRHRLTEYGDDDRHATHVIEEILPHLQRRFALEGRTVMLGSSMGAVASLGVAWHRPDHVSGVALLSGSFANRLGPERPEPIFGPVSDLVGRLDVDDRLATIRAYVSCGRYEGLIDLNRALVPRLRAIGMPVQYQETWEGHQWASWRDRLATALTHSLG